jgi:hypothetical protein
MPSGTQQQVMNTLLGIQRAQQDMLSTILRIENAQQQMLETMRTTYFPVTFAAEQPGTATAMPSMPTQMYSAESWDTLGGIHIPRITLGGHGIPLAAEVIVERHRMENASSSSSFPACMPSPRFERTAAAIRTPDLL